MRRITCSSTYSVPAYFSVVFFLDLFFVFCVHVYVHHVCAKCTQKSEEALHPLIIELQVCVSQYLCAENWT